MDWIDVWLKQYTYIKGTSNILYQYIDVLLDISVYEGHTQNVMYI